MDRNYKQENLQDLLMLLDANPSWKLKSYGIKKKKDDDFCEERVGKLSLWGTVLLVSVNRL